MNGRKGCYHCIFYRHYSGLGNEKGCHYAFYTGKLRPCPPEKCTVKDTREHMLEKYKRMMQNPYMSRGEENGELRV